MHPRDAGVLCHITSLPGRFGQGTFGAQARGFVDQTAQAGLKLWQILPLNPPNKEGSPYQSVSSRAIHPAYIDFDDLTALGFDSVDSVATDPARLDFDLVQRHRAALYPRLNAWLRSPAAPADLKRGLEKFVKTQTWLRDFALFQIAADAEGTDRPWWTWSDAMKYRDAATLDRLIEEHREAFETVLTAQFLAYHQWQALRTYARDRGIRIVGDLPIYVAANSADTWSDPDQFQLDYTGAPSAVAGVPPDYFAENGQLWGNPLYNWDAMRRDGYQWWSDRLGQAADLFDVVRIDHFRGFSRYWSVPATAETAVEGQWVDGPGQDVFRHTEDAYQGLEIIAEDLGDIDEWVVALRDGLGFPGMRVIQFAFDGNPSNPHALQNHMENSVCYLGTHDNPTTMGWLAGLDHDARAGVCAALGLNPSEDDSAITRALMRLTLSSPSKYAVLTAQDILGLGDEAIMNRPGESDGNWQWRLTDPTQLTTALGQIQHDLSETGRKAS